MSSIVEIQDRIKETIHKLKILLDEKNITSAVKVDGNISADFSEKISKLEKENQSLKSELKTMKQEHEMDLNDLDRLIDQVSLILEAKHD